MTGRWQCQRCGGEKVEIHVNAVGGGIREARQIICQTCDEADRYMLDLILKEKPVRTQFGKFQWVTGQRMEENDMDVSQLEILIHLCHRQKLLLKTARYVALIGDEEQARELAQVEADLKSLEELRAEQGIQAV